MLVGDGCCDHSVGLFAVFAAGVDEYVYHRCYGWCWALQLDAKGGQLLACGAVGAFLDCYDSGCGDVGGCINGLVLECAAFLELVWFTLL
jgi:hypothetical protein